MLLKVVFVGVRKYRLTSYSTITVAKLVLTDCVYREQCLDHLLFLGTLYIEVCAINPFWKGEPGLYVTRGFMKIFDQLFFTFLPHYGAIRHLAIDSCYVFYNNWNATMNLEEDESFTISRVRFVDYDLSFYHFDKKVLGMVKYHTKHANNHSEACVINHHYTDCQEYLQSAGIVGDRSVEQY